MLQLLCFRATKNAATTKRQRFWALIPRGSAGRVVAGPEAWKPLAIWTLSAWFSGGENRTPIHVHDTPAHIHEPEINIYIYDIIYGSDISAD